MNESEVTNTDLESLIEAIYHRFQYDFRHYARSSIRRRVEQAISTFHCKSVRDLQDRLLHEETFFPKLLAYLTVNTTEFFRDPSFFKSLRENVIPYLKTYPSTKIWIAGCSTGEEVISLAIMLREAGIKRYMLYATDINPINLDRAKKAIYSSEGISKAELAYKSAGGQGTLADYYHAAYESVQFKEALLDNVVFADHSLATDSVFSEMHLISCRNVLIYFEKPLQERVFGLFHDSLVRDGFLGLGPKETLQFSKFKEHFKIVDQENKIYQRTISL